MLVTIFIISICIKCTQYFKVCKIVWNDSDWFLLSVISLVQWHIYCRFPWWFRIKNTSKISSLVLFLCVQNNLWLNHAICLNFLWIFSCSTLNIHSYFRVLCLWIDISFKLLLIVESMKFNFWIESYLFEIMRGQRLKNWNSFDYNILKFLTLNVSYDFLVWWLDIVNASFFL